MFRMLFSFVININPEFSDLKDPGDLILLLDNKSKTKKYVEFKNVIINLDSSNLLREFVEYKDRYQYNTINYDTVCKSFQEQYQDNQFHQITQRLWTLSLLDTINERPQEARSRMPNTSIDGSEARN